MLAPRVTNTSIFCKKSMPLGFSRGGKFRWVPLAQRVQCATGDSSVFLRVSAAWLLWPVLPSSAGSFHPLSAPLRTHRSCRSPAHPMPRRCGAGHSAVSPASRGQLLLWTLSRERGFGGEARQERSPAGGSGVKDVLFTLLLSCGASPSHLLPAPEPPCRRQGLGCTACQVTAMSLPQIPLPLLTVAHGFTFRQWLTGCEGSLPLPTCPRLRLNSSTRQLTENCQCCVKLCGCVAL